MKNETLGLWKLGPFYQNVITMGCGIKLQFIYSEKVTKFCETSTIDLSYVVIVNSTTVETSQNFVAFSEYMNFKTLNLFCRSIKLF